MTTGRKMKLSGTMQLALEAIALHGDKAGQFVAIKPQTADALWAGGYLGIDRTKAQEDTCVTPRGYAELARAGSVIVSEAVARAAQAKAEAIVATSPSFRAVSEALAAAMPVRPMKLELIRGGRS